VINNQLSKIDKKLHKLIENCDDYKIKNDIFQSIPGVSNVVAFSLLSNMPELGYITNKEAAALVGVAPINRESGSYEGKPMIHVGQLQLLVTGETEPCFKIDLVHTGLYGALNNFKAGVTCKVLNDADIQIGDTIHITEQLTLF